jgi:DUF1009 family protein
MAADTAGRSETVRDQGPLAIIAGSGELPGVIAEEVIRSGRDVFIIEIEGETDCDLSCYPRASLPIGAAGRLKALLEEHNCRDVLMTGNVRRPRFSEIEWDMGMVKALSGLVRLRVGGDDKVVNGVVHIFESEGFRVVGPLDVAPGLAAPKGEIGRVRPGKKARTDIELGLNAIERLGPLDIGQAVVVLSGRIVAVEAAEGTDSMLSRCAMLRENGRIAVPAPSGVLVKASKPGQEMRLDMPVVGLETVKAAVAAGLEGIAVEASNVLMPQIADVRAVADAAGLFVIGVDAGNRTGERT